MTSIEWLVEQLIPEDQHEGIMDIIEDAKERHKQEIIDASNGYTTTEPLGVTKGEYYYQETFVSKGSGMSEKPNNHIEPQLPQQEISDEEIEKASYKFWEFKEHTASSAWKMGAKWYREQLKNK